MRTYPLIITFISAFWLTGCASLFNEPPPQNKTQNWGARVSTLSDVKNWTLHAVIGIQNNTKKNDVTANLTWTQTQKNYSILLFGPLGAGSAKLSSMPGKVKLETSDGKTYTAPTPELLLAEQTNWNLPVSSLYYWIRGLPVPELPVTKQLDAYHHLVELQQQGWKIQFLRYTSINHIDLPSKIFLFNSQMNVKIVIKEWKI